MLSAVTHEEVARIRLALGQPAPAPPDELVRLGLRGLLLAALTGPQISVALSAVAGIVALLNNVIDVARDGEGLVARLDTVHEVVLAIAIVLGGAYVLSFVAAIAVFAGFEVRREGDVLRISRGLLALSRAERPAGARRRRRHRRGPRARSARARRIADRERRLRRWSGRRGRTLLPLVRRRRRERP